MYELVLNVTMLDQLGNTTEGIPAYTETVL